jgi:hypothetical protein
LLGDYRIFETDQFQKDLKQIALSGHRKVAQKLIDFVYPQLREPFLYLKQRSCVS